LKTVATDHTNANAQDAARRIPPSWINSADTIRTIPTAGRDMKRLWFHTTSLFKNGRAGKSVKSIMVPPAAASFFEPRKS
jgi:hypothetical protein